MSAAAPFALPAMAAAWVHAVTSIAKRVEAASVCVQESQTESEAQIVVRAAEKFTGTNISTNRLYAIHAVATVNSNADPAEAAPPRWDVYEISGAIGTCPQIVVNAILAD